VTGVDLSREFLDAARRCAAAEGVEADWREGDLRALDAGGDYDAALCLGNSYGYLDEEESELFLAGVARSLRPGGGFALDTGVAAESILANAEKRQWHLAGGVYLLSEARYDAFDSRLDIDYTFLWDGRSETRRSSSHVVTAGALRRRIERAGFRVEAMTAGPGGPPYKLGSPHLVVIAFKAG
jgi:SAM-dependent methyltransferase